jgi:putative nucleotide binding protein
MRRNLKEDYAIVLDFLPHGRPFSGRRIPVAQVLGENYFILLEVVPKKGISLEPNERIYLGPDKRDKVHHVVGRIKLGDLTNAARVGLPQIIEELVQKREREFVEFFNRAGPITTRFHQLELLPGIGKRHMWKILEEREKKKFESFEEIKQRIDLLPDPKKAVIKRIIEELEGKDKYKIFVC